MKRFSDTNDWRDPWYRKLTPQAKHLRKYLWDNCDCAGVIALDLESVSFHVGEPINKEHLSELGDWLQTLPNGKLLIPSFVGFQCGELRESCPAHKPVMRVVAAHGLICVGSLYSHSDRLPNSLLDRQQEKEKEKDKDKEKEEGGMGETKRNGALQPLPVEAEFWNANRGKLSKVLDCGSSRKAHLAARRQDSFWVANYEQAVKKVVASKFCNGDNDHQWKADFAWLIERPDAVAKVMEGKYDNKPETPKKYNGY